MTNKEKVLKGLENCAIEQSCWGCPYCKGNPTCQDDLCKDALELLKEQEPVEPTFKQDYDGIFVWACGSCGAYMYHIYAGIDKAKEYAKYCRQCGRPVRWE